MKKKVCIGLLLGFSLFFVFIVCFFFRIKVSYYENDFLAFHYDTTWKVKSGKNEVILQHKRGKIRFQEKDLGEDFIEIELKNIIKDVVYNIEEQNEDYKLIDSRIFDTSFAYLYENQDCNVLVRVYKLDEKLVVGYFEADINYFDILLDSVEEIFNSLKIIK